VQSADPNLLSPLARWVLRGIRVDPQRGCRTFWGVSYLLRGVNPPEPPPSNTALPLALTRCKTDSTAMCMCVCSTAVQRRSGSVSCRSQLTVREAGLRLVVAVLLARWLYCRLDHRARRHRRLSRTLLSVLIASRTHSTHTLIAPVSTRLAAAMPTGRIADSLECRPTGLVTGRSINKSINWQLKSWIETCVRLEL